MKSTTGEQKTKNSQNLGDLKKNVYTIRKLLQKEHYMVATNDMDTFLSAFKDKILQMTTDL